MSAESPAATGIVLPFDPYADVPHTADTADDGQKTPDTDRRRSWKPIDLTDVLEGRYQPPTPTVGRRDDGTGLFYSRRVHTVASESEGGKTWFAVLAAAVELAAGNSVLYLDFEDDEGGVVGRLLTLGVDRTAIRDRFIYIRPEEDLRALGNSDDLAAVLNDYRPTLAILDGVTEAMAMHGMELKDNTEIATFGRNLLRRIAEQGPATVALDHVTKDREGRGRYAIGGVHKLNAVNGAAYVLQNRKPFGIGVTGRSGVYIAKDRPAQLRRHAVPAGEGMHWFADLVIQSHGEEFVEANLYAPVEKEDKGLRPTHVMAKVSKMLEEAHPGGLSKNAIEGGVGGKRDYVRLALETLVNEGYVSVTKDGNAKLHTFVRAFIAD